MHLPFGCGDAAPRFSAIVARQLNAMINDAIEQPSRTIEGIIASRDRSFASVFLRKEQADADFRGRDADDDAMLRQRGLAA